MDSTSCIVWPFIFFDNALCFRDLSGFLGRFFEALVCLGLNLNYLGLKKLPNFLYILVCLIFQIYISWFIFLGHIFSMSIPIFKIVWNKFFSLSCNMNRFYFSYCMAFDFFVNAFCFGDLPGFSGCFWEIFRPFSGR